MNVIDFNNPCKVHFIGIGGISMSGFAELLHDKGFTVTGSDAKSSAVTKRLEDLGIKIHYGTSADNVAPDAKAVIFTAAVKEDNPELIRARQLGCPVIERAALVSDIMLQFANNYCVAGTHGKTTSTSMLSLVFMEADLDPTVSVGGIMPELGGNMRIGHSDNFVIESCEYTDSFLKFHPSHAIITNVEAEHLDYFGTEENYRASFRRFAELVPENGLLMVNAAIPDCDKLFADLPAKVMHYGLPTDAENLDYTAADIGFNDQGFGFFTLVAHGKKLGGIELSVIGMHNVSNAVAVSGLALECGISFEVISKALKSYKGTGRRFEVKGVTHGVTVVDDYAHHPTEMRATLEAAKKVPHNRIICVFQPHTFSRTRAFLNELAEALTLADEIVLADIYPAREPDLGDISSRDIKNVLLNKFGRDSHYFSSFDEIENFLLQISYENDLLITMGAGDVVKIGETLLGR